MTLGGPGLDKRRAINQSASSPEGKPSQRAVIRPVAMTEPLDPAARTPPAGRAARRSRPPRRPTRPKS